MAPGEDSSTLSVLRPSTSAASRRVLVEAFPPVYRVFRAVAGLVLRGWFDLRVQGVDRLPVSGPFILASNHHNYLDGVVLGVAVPRPISFLVMPRVFRATPLHPPFHRRIGSIPMAPGSGRSSATGIEPIRRWKGGCSGVARNTRGITRNAMGRGTATPSTTPSR